MNTEFTPTVYHITENHPKSAVKIRHFLEKRFYLQEQFNDMMDNNSTTISKIEIGKFSIMVDYLVRFTIFLDYKFKVIEK